MIKRDLAVSGRAISKAAERDLDHRPACSKKLSIPSARGSRAASGPTRRAHRGSARRLFLDGAVGADCGAGGMTAGAHPHDGRPSGWRRSTAGSLRSPGIHLRRDR